ncbi:OB-fold domain-containing protein [Actinomadura sp. DC4]|uniref:OB-fold domain-containing protein n=1 Tax=Actinomadura sp. DC4 TaxID=3055069 RepID=UPI0025B0594E|nr:OB-fold domain-containing protein [Actinomadura sp. DC4]MDN3357595.1 OB-fold domain-containing protein [Actinomadura sp. DC4]
MRGILGWGSYLPYGRLDRAGIGPVAGAGGGTGFRTVASYDEDTTTMGVAAARRALRGAACPPGALWFATTDPAYADRTNAAALHAALRLDPSVAAYDLAGAVRSASGALRAGLAAAEPSLVVAADRRTGAPGGADEAAGGDGAAALLVGSDADGPLLAESLGWTSLTEEFLDRWRAPGEAASHLWEERFGAGRYTGLGIEALTLALGAAGLGPEDVGTLIVAGLHGRAAGAVAARSGVPPARIADRLDATVGNVGAAQPALLLAAALESGGADRIVVLLTLADGADAAVFRTTGALADHAPPAAERVRAQAEAGGPVGYGTYLRWRGQLRVEPPRRPAPARPSASAAARGRDWKYGLVGSQEGRTVRLPPSPLDEVHRPMADATGTIAAFTVDRLAYSPSPPVVFAVVDFDGGGRLPVELTDVEEDEVRVGGRVEMTFRRLFTAEGVHNYFWKARPVRAPGEER